MSDPTPDWLATTDEQLRDQVIAAGEEKAGVRGGPTVALFRGLWEAMAMMIVQIFQSAIRPIMRHADPREATGWYLRMHGIWAGVHWRSEARATRGHATLTSTEDATIPAGARITAAGQVLTVDAESALTAAVPAVVAVTAETPGATGNIAAGAEDITVSGDDVPATVTAELLAGWITIYGFDADDDDEVYRPRVLAGLLVRGEANTRARYRLAAIGVPGVSDVATARTPRGYGSMDLSVIVRGDLPTDADLDLVSAALEEAGLVCRDLWVRAPSVVTAQVSAEITGTATTAAVEAAINRWWQTNIGIGSEVLVQSLYRDAVTGIPGVESIVYLAPLTNLPQGDIDVVSAVDQRRDGRIGAAAHGTY